MKRRNASGIRKIKMKLAKKKWITNSDDEEEEDDDERGDDDENEEADSGGARRRLAANSRGDPKGRKVPTEAAERVSPWRRSL